MTEGNLEVRGYTSFNRPASKRIRIFASIVDIGIILLISTLVIDALNILPSPRLSTLGLLLFIGLIYWAPQRILFGITCGERFWKLKAKRSSAFSIRANLFELDYLPKKAFLTSSLFSGIAITVSSFIFIHIIQSHPIWIPATVWRMEPFVPTEAEWQIVPFFYTIGGWPNEFQGKPVFYSLPYEYGPPYRFVGHVVARWDSPEIQLTFEGPKTPDHIGSRKEIRDCILMNSALSYGCILAREKSLARHIQEIQQTQSKIRSTVDQPWSLRWFSVENPTLSPEDRPQGIYLSSTNKNSIEDRFVLIHENGTHQAFILKRSKTEKGRIAFDLVQKSIRSLRDFGELQSGRAWINQSIGEIRLDDLKNIQDPKLLERQFSKIQSMLISRITVEPGSYESYFHLAGISLLLVQSSAATLVGKPKIYARDNIFSAYRFAKDLAPKDPRNALLENYYLESGKVK